MTTEEHIKFINHHNITVTYGQHKVELIYYYGDKAWIKFQNKNLIVNRDNIKIQTISNPDKREHWEKAGYSSYGDWEQAIHDFCNSF